MVGNSGIGKKWMDLEYVLVVELKALDWETEEKKGING